MSVGSIRELLHFLILKIDILHGEITDLHLIVSDEHTVLGLASEVAFTLHTRQSVQ